jgi:hypothetical protein
MLQNTTKSCFSWKTIYWNIWEWFYSVHSIEEVTKNSFHIASQAETRKLIHSGAINQQAISPRAVWLSPNRQSYLDFHPIDESLKTLSYLDNVLCSKNRPQVCRFSFPRKPKNIDKRLFSKKQENNREDISKTISSGQVRNKTIAQGYFFPFCGNEAI